MPDGNHRTWRQWLVRAQLRVSLWLVGGKLPCGCHWRAPYRPVVMAGCARHD